LIFSDFLLTFSLVRVHFIHTEEFTLPLRYKFEKAQAIPSYFSLYRLILLILRSDFRNFEFNFYSKELATS